MVFSNVVADITVLGHSFVFSLFCVQVPASFPNIGVWQSAHLILYTAPCLSHGWSLFLTLVSIRRKVVTGLITLINLRHSCPYDNILEVLVEVFFLSAIHFPLSV